MPIRALLNAKETLLKALRLLDEAISRDAVILPWLIAGRRVANLRTSIGFDFDHTPTRLAEAKATAQKALELAARFGGSASRPALFYYHGSLRDYDLARLGI